MVTIQKYWFVGLVKSSDLNLPLHKPFERLELALRTPFVRSAHNESLSENCDSNDYLVHYQGKKLHAYIISDLALRKMKTGYDTIRLKDLNIPRIITRSHYNLFLSKVMPFAPSVSICLVLYLKCNSANSRRQTTYRRDEIKLEGRNKTCVCGTKGVYGKLDAMYGKIPFFIYLYLIL